MSGPPGRSSRSSVASAGQDADAVVVSEMPVGRANVGNLRAIVPVADRVVFVGAFGPDRDYTGGDASALVAEALAGGAVIATDTNEALHSIARLSRAAGTCT